MESGGVNDNGQMSNEDTAIHHDSNDIFVSAQSKPKNSSSVIIGMICLAIIAACEIGFGVWAMLNGNQKVAKLNGQTAELLDNAMLIYYGEQARNGTVRDMCFNIDGNNYSVDFNVSSSEDFIKYFMNEDNYSKI
jgi:hypothetical protein